MEARGDIWGKVDGVHGRTKFLLLVYMEIPNVRTILLSLCFLYFTSCSKCIPSTLPAVSLLPWEPNSRCLHSRGILGGLTDSPGARVATSTLFTLDCTMYIASYTLYTVYRTPFTVCCAPQYTVHCILQQPPTLTISWYDWSIWWRHG